MLKEHERRKLPANEKFAKGGSPGWLGWKNSRVRGEGLRYVTSAGSLHVRCQVPTAKSQVGQSNRYRQKAIRQPRLFSLQKQSLTSLTKGDVLIAIVCNIYFMSGGLFNLFCVF
jgi:hypothetical protein